VWVCGGAQTAIQQRLHEPCRRVDEAEVAELVVKLSALKEALKECENWRAFEREEHQKVAIRVVQYGVLTI
jgi:hypothetical protein